jgi:hypothetical protein
MDGGCPVSYRNGRLMCDMHKDCTALVSRMDDKGFAYCEEHGQTRKQYRPCRKLRPLEIRWLAADLSLLGYRPEGNTRVRLRARQEEICLKDCGADHSDACYRAQRVVGGAQ